MPPHYTYLPGSDLIRLPEAPKRLPLTDEQYRKGYDALTACLFDKVQLAADDEEERKRLFFLEDGQARPVDAGLLRSEDGRRKLVELAAANRLFAFPPGKASRVQIALDNDPQEGFRIQVNPFLDKFLEDGPLNRLFGDAAAFDAADLSNEDRDELQHTADVLAEKPPYTGLAAFFIRALNRITFGLAFRQESAELEQYGQRQEQAKITLRGYTDHYKDAYASVNEAFAETDRARISALEAEKETVGAAIEQHLTEKRSGPAPKRVSKEALHHRALLENRKLQNRIEALNGIGPEADAWEPEEAQEPVEAVRSLLCRAIEQNPASRAGAVSMKAAIRLFGTLPEAEGRELEPFVNGMKKLDSLMDEGRAAEKLLLEAAVGKTALGESERKTAIDRFAVSRSLARHLQCYTGTAAEPGQLPEALTDKSSFLSKLCGPLSADELRQSILGGLSTGRLHMLSAKEAAVELNLPVGLKNYQKTPAAGKKRSAASPAPTLGSGTAEKPRQHGLE